jgi:hypothetical protein
MRELGVWDQCRYPGFSEDAEAPFRGLNHDLGFAEEFLSGSATILRTAAIREALEIFRRDEQLAVAASGDVKTLEKMHSLFREKKYEEVVALADNLKYPDRMRESEQRMLDIAQKKIAHRR